MDCKKTVIVKLSYIAYFVAAATKLVVVADRFAGLRFPATPAMSPSSSALLLTIIKICT